MLIRKIQLVDFKSHPKTTIEMNRLTVIRSNNAVGKSSIEQGIQLALAGRCEGTSADGKGSAGLIRKGETKGYVKMLIEDEGDRRVIKCDLNGTSKVVGISDPTDPQWADGVAYSDWLYANRETVSCLVNNRHFVDLSDDKQKDVLSAILLPKTYVWPDWVMPAANGLNLKIDWRLSPFELIEQAYKAAYAERTAINRSIKEFRMPEGDTSTAEAYGAIEDKLKARKDELEKAVSDLAAAKATHNQKAVVRESAQRRYSECKARVDREEATVTRLDGLLLAPAALKKAQESAKSAAKVTRLDSELLRIGAELRVKKSQRDDLSKVEEGATCPTCKGTITGELIASIARPILEDIERLAQEEQTTVTERKKYGDPVAAQRQVEAHEQANRDMVSAKGRAADESVAMRDAEAKLEQIGNSLVPDWSEQEAVIAELRTRVHNGTSILADAGAARELLARQKSAQAEKDILTKKQEDVERLVRYFGDEVKAQLLKESIDPFAEKMNAILANWGYHCIISIEPYCFAIKFRGEKGEFPIELKNLSKSQRYRFATAFQVALAVATEFRFVVVDEADIFDAAGRAGLFQALTSGDLDQAIVMATDAREKVPSKEDQPDAIFWMLENSAEPGEVPVTTARELL